MLALEAGAPILVDLPGNVCGTYTERIGRRIGGRPGDQWPIKGLRARPGSTSSCSSRGRVLVIVVFFFDFLFLIATSPCIVLDHASVRKRLSSNHWHYIYTFCNNSYGRRWTDLQAIFAQNKCIVFSGRGGMLS